MKKILVATIAAATTLFAAQAHAWGAREQGILAGIAGTVILGQIFANSGQAQAGYPPVQVGGYPQPQYPQPPVIVNVPPVVQHYPVPAGRVCDSFPMYDPHGRYHGNRTVCRSVY